MRRMDWKSLFPSRRDIMGINARNLEMIYTHNDRRNFPNVDDKLKCKSLLATHGIPTPDTYHVVSGPQSLAAWPAKLSDHDRFVVKPTHGYGGEGIMLVRKEEGRLRSSGEEKSVEDISFHIMQILNGAFALDNVSDTAFFERTLANDPGLAPFLPDGVDGVADIRIIYRLDTPVMAMLRLPTRESDGKANLHQGGIGVGIDLASGLSLDGVHHNTAIAEHPETGLRLRGHPVPHFAKMVETGRNISDIVGLGYIGVDFIADRDQGPVVIEVNARPGLNIQLANQAGLRGRLRDV